MTKPIIYSHSSVSENGQYIKNCLSGHDFKLWKTHNIYNANKVPQRTLVCDFLKAIVVWNLFLK